MNDFTNEFWAAVEELTEACMAKGLNPQNEFDPSWNDNDIEDILQKAFSINPSLY